MFGQSTLDKKVIIFSLNEYDSSTVESISYKSAVYYRDFDKHYVKNYGWHILKIEDLTSE